MKTLSDSKKKLVNDRINQSINEQITVYEKIREGRPLDAEENEARKVAYINRQVGVNNMIAKKIASNVDPKLLNLSTAKTSKAESIQGATIDFIDICFLDLAKAASRAVARIIRPDGSPIGTGFMVSPDLLITNHHVIESKDDADFYLAEFNYERDFNKKDLPFTRFKMNPKRFFISSPENKLDFTLVALGDKVSGPLSVEQIGFLPLINTPDKHIKGIFLNCIQHPNGDPKQLVVRENRLLNRTTNTLIYSSDTLPGSSGSPLFNDDWEVVGLHHYGAPYRSLIDNPAKALLLPKNANEGIRISSILDFLEDLEKLSPEEDALLNTVMDVTFRHPSLIINAKSESVLEINKNPLPIDDLTVTPTVPVVSNGQLTFTVPLKITVQLGSEIIVPAQQKIEEETGQPQPKQEIPRQEALKPDDNYTTRKGYNPNFLGIKVPLPELTTEQFIKASKVKETSSSEFKYQHFSVVMNAQRRLAFFTAVNIDGASVIKINRKTGDVTSGPELAEDAEAREKWYQDPRISDDEVAEDKLYKNHPEMKQFQRGHLVKRTDPSWGTRTKAVRAQADTFHFTNCSPQHFRFNPIISRWAGIENWITSTSDNENIRVTVFCGPVFDENDYLIDYLQIPEQFWKVVIWTEEGELRATGMIADQGMLITKINEAVPVAEDLSQPPGALKEFQCTIEHIEELTQLSFGNIRQFDTYPQSESTAKMRKIKIFEDLHLKISKMKATPTDN